MRVHVCTHSEVVACFEGYVNTVPTVASRVLLNTQSNVILTF